MPPKAEGSFAYTTLITRASYLAGVVILAHTLEKYYSAHPLIVFYTQSLPRSSIRALELEAPRTNLILRPCEALLPRSDIAVHLIAERFADTWTKLRVFELVDYDTVCYLDADMIVRRNMDNVFSRGADLPPDWIAANHACVCNLDHDPWAPADWTRENCAYTPLSHPAALTQPMKVTPESRPTHHLLNSGMFLFHPSQDLWDRMLDFFNTTDKLSTYKFPDQDFLADFFRNKWRSLGWQFNALKTMRYWHTNIWRDEEVVCLHYIVDKPWAARIGEDGVAGYKGRDGVTHGWWWEEYGEWVRSREQSGQSGLLEIVAKHVARPEGEEGEEDEDMLAIGAKVQAFAGNKAPGGKKIVGAEGAEQQDSEQEPPQGGHGPVLRKKMLGERGHGPVVRPHGRGMMRP